MGCAASKLEDLPVVSLCRDRCKFLEQALSQTQALSDAHVAYLASLRTLGPALHRFFDDVNNTIHCHCNGPPPPESESESDSASHLQFPSDSESETQVKGARKQSDEAPTPVNDDDDEYYRNSGGGLASKPPPPPPSPISSTWDLFNFFDAYDRERYLPSLLYSSTHLEPEEAATPAAADKIKHNNIDINNDIGDEEEQRTRPKEKSKTIHLATSTTPPSAFVKQHKQKEQNKQGVSEEAEAMRELHLLFDRASESGNQVLKSLQSHHHTISLHQEYGFGNHEGLVISSQGLSYTLKTLLLWEKKLYDEVKAEERLRVTHEKKSRMLKQLEHNKGTAESPKVESVRTALGNVSTKMKIAIQIVDKISVTINKLRDEKLWPQIVEFIHRLLGMWKGMVECHKSQYQAITEASKGLDAIAISNVKLLNGAHDLETAIQLKLELQNWNVCFSNWIATQKGYVKALNGWLLRCLLQEPSPQPDEEGGGAAVLVVPLSPGRLGAPPAFVICNQWSQAMDRLSGKEVIEAIRGFYTRIHLLLMEHHVDAETLLQRMVIENKDVARKLRLVEERKEEEEQKVLMRGRGKKNIIGLSLRAAQEEVGERENNNGSRNNNLVWDLKQTLMAMEKFTANSLKAYKELDAHIEQVSSPGLSA